MWFDGLRNVDVRIVYDSCGIELELEAVHKDSANRACFWFATIGMAMLQSPRKRAFCSRQH